ncbi:MAG: nucleotidyltransferase family protein [Halieaceae bacterium]|jgi:GTP:adenosylcobinamide-phosphate guanylyltransferase|nr:nucleotidyltransferase family protein [Halieaceae bacterium]
MIAVVLAGDRTKKDSLIKHSRAGCKALIEIDGIPMVRRVLNALQQSRAVSKIVLAGPEAHEVAMDKPLSELIASEEISWYAPEASPSASAYHTMQSLEPDTPVLLTTTDHPLLTREIVDAFSRQSLADDADVTVGLAPYALITEAYPGIKKTVFRFSDGDFCGCNLFAFLTPEGRQAASFWRKIEQQRKKPLVLIGLLGWRMVLRYRLGLLSLEEALCRLGKRLGLRMHAVILPYANAAIDVDSIADLELVSDFLADRRETTLPFNSESTSGTAGPVR